MPAKILKLRLCKECAINPCRAINKTLCTACDTTKSREGYHARKGTTSGYNQSVSSYKANLKRKWGMSISDFDLLYDKTGGICPICSAYMHKPPSKEHRATTACVDHCHITGKIRGVICRTCNLGLGYFKDDPESLKLASAYLGGEENVGV